MLLFSNLDFFSIFLTVWTVLSACPFLRGYWGLENFGVKPYSFANVLFTKLGTVVCHYGLRNAVSSENFL